MLRLVLLTLLAAARVHAADLPARVLFVGNSYTYQVPKTFEALCRDGHHAVVTGEATRGGWKLSDHAGGGTTNRFREGWDVIVLQEQSLLPSFPEETVRKMSLPAAQTLTAAARAAGARPLFYLTWGREKGNAQQAELFPNDTYTLMQSRLNEGYALLARETKSDLAPVGRAWQLARQLHPDIALYQKDGSHPSAAGVYLAACVFYAAICHDDPRRLTENNGLPAATAAHLRAAAAEAVK
jgi:hypothetical protein